MAFKTGRGVLYQLPIRNPADTAGPVKPLIAKPARGPAVSGIGNYKCLVAMGGNPGLVADPGTRER